jgi:hypothetical protein
MLEFVPDLQSTNGALEIAIDGIGRAELLNGRLRITLFRQIQGINGRMLYVPALCTVWAVPAYRMAARSQAAIRKRIEELAATNAEAALPQLGMLMH